MLVLSRRRGEAIRIGESVEVRVLKIKGATVRLGISAPRMTKVLRVELEDRLRKCSSCGDMHTAPYHQCQACQDHYRASADLGPHEKD